MSTGAADRGLITDLGTGIAFLTRLPVRGAAPSDASLARAAWTFPIVGALVGAVGGLAYFVAAFVGLYPLIAATLAVTAAMLATGALHEDGLADTADGFGASGDRARKLEIMRDSRIGTYGVTALILATLLKVGAIASLISPLFVVPALIAAHAAARATLPVFMRLMPPARKDGLAAEAGRPSLASAGIAASIGVAVLIICLGPMTALAAIVLLGGAAAVTAWLAKRQIGGQTGDVLGALEQAGEIAVLLAVSALL